MLNFEPCTPTSRIFLAFNKHAYILMPKHCDMVQKIEYK